MYTIAKKFTFSASHCLSQMPVGHPCKLTHGHNYEVELLLESEELNEYDFVLDYRELDKAKPIIDELDHAHLNDLVSFNPTSENLAHMLYHRLKESIPQLAAVRISETPKTWAEYRP